MIEELWKDVCGYEGLYMVSSLGRVKSLDYHRTGKEKILKPCENKGGYLTVALCKNNMQKTFTVHRLVATTFIPNPDNKPHIDHINTIRTDNRVENLMWCTAKENNNNVLTRSKRYGANNHKARGILQFTKDGAFVRKWDCIADAERELGFHGCNISLCCSGNLKTSNGFIWKYA